MATSRSDIQSAVDRDTFVAGVGHMRGFPSRPGESSAATTGVPTDSVKGFGPGAIFQNWKGAPGSLLYVNQGTVSSSNWFNIY